MRVPSYATRHGKTCPFEWEDIAGEYPSDGNEREQDEWREGEVFWNESMDYWESISESGIFEVSAVFSMVLILLSIGSIPFSGMVIEILD